MTAEELVFLFAVLGLPLIMLLIRLLQLYI